MAPKMKVHRSKKGEGSSSQARLLGSPSQTQTRAMHSLAGRSVATGRLVDFHFLDRKKLYLGAALEKQGWAYMLRTELPIFPNLVKEFYQNLVIVDLSASSLVKGVNIELNVEAIGSMLKVPSTGVLLDEGVQRKERIDLVFGPGRGDELESLDANRLFPEQRLLHHIISRIFIPRTGSFDKVTERDLMLMTHIISRTPYNFPMLMLIVMKEALARHRGCLPYGMFLTHIFKHCGVSFKNEESIKLLHTDKYNLNTLHRMGFFRHNGMWFKKGTEHQNVGGQSSSHAQPSSSAEHLQGASSSSINLSHEQIQQIAREIYSYSSSQSNSANSSSASDVSLIGASVSSVQQSISSLMIKMKNLQNEVSDIKKEMSIQMNDLKHQILSGSGSHEEIRQSLEMIQSMVTRLSISETQSGPCLDEPLQPPPVVPTPDFHALSVTRASSETVPYRRRRIRRKREDGQTSPPSEKCQ